MFECNIRLFPELVPHIHVIAEASVHAAARFPDRSVDIVMIDADHSAEAVFYDLCVWHRKVRRGGIIAGHDMYPFSGVEFAVKWFTNALNLSMPKTSGWGLFLFRHWHAPDIAC